MHRKTELTESVAKAAAAVAAGFAFAWFACLIVLFQRHAWILDNAGRPIVTDFLEVWVAGRTALAGAAVAAYDPVLHHAAQAAAIGHGFQGYLWWHYPPVVLFLAAALALLPYLAAFLIWVAGTLALYAGTIAAIAKNRLAGLLACAMPPVFANAMTGQNGFLTAALIGLALVNLEARPLLAGAFVGLLAYKPQFGLLFPLILASSGKWKTFCCATAVAAATVLVPCAVFGSETLRAFLHYLPLANNSLLVHGAAGWNKLQTVYGALRWLGFDNSAASVVQATVSVSTAAALVWLWRSQTRFALKAAALATAVLLCTPYTYMYDLPVIAVALAFLHRERSFDMVELGAIVLANLCLLAFAAFAVPTGSLAVAAVGIIIVRRIRAVRTVRTPQAIALQGVA